MKKLIFILSLLVFSLHGDSFSKGNKSIGVKLGSASIGKEDYTIAGASLNYFIIDNLSAGAGYENWFSGDPGVQKLTLEGTFFLPVNETLHPYIGIFARRIFLDGTDFLGRSYDDMYAYGYRAGLAIQQDRVILGAGIVQEKYENDTFIFTGVDTYVELTVGFAF